MYKVGVMGIWFSVPGAMWKARCLMIGMSRWWTIATWNKGSESMYYYYKESESMSRWWTIVTWNIKQSESIHFLYSNVEGLLYYFFL